MNGQPLPGTVAAKPIPQTIVAEVSQNYVDGVPTTRAGWPNGLAQRFELVIATNEARGYRLRDWKLSRVVSPTHFGSAVPNLNETIIAIFEYVWQVKD